MPVMRPTVRNRYACQWRRQRRWRRHELGHAVMQRVRRRVSVCLVLLALSPGLRAHEVSVEQIVELTIRPLGDRMDVRLRVPATLLADAKLPRLDDGGLDAKAMEGRLDIVAADAARNLDLRRDDTVLRLLSQHARVGADRTSVEIEL